MSESIQFFAKRKKIYPRRVWGKFRKLKWAAMVTLLGIYYGAPWLRWERGGPLPDQAILIDLQHTRAYFFGIEIWPQEVYYITGLLILAAVGLFFVTSLFGRVWCGYACPQTVWTDLFIWVERLVQGDRNARKKLDESPWGFKKIYKKGLTHLLWLLIGLCTGGAWVFYFNDAPTLLDQIVHFDVPWVVGGWILGLTFSTYLMAGFAREQVCTYMCPYARFQSAMFDKDTLIIAYDVERGEPRGKWKKKEEYLAHAAGRATYQPAATALLTEAKPAAQAPVKSGHCIDCDSCVVVCPMGIDIREGLQMQCIACGLCVDACDTVMEKIGLPKGLIRYDTESKKPFNPFHPRSFWYAGIIALVGGLMLYGLLTRSPLGLNVIHDRNPLMVTLSDGSVRNGYTLHILNKSHSDQHYALSVLGLDNAHIRVQGSTDIPGDSLPVFADSAGNFRVFVTAGKQKEHRRSITFQLVEAGGTLRESTDSIFVSEVP
ncbi:MAG: cytochrome c oxidase accessory protein CcoG [Alphaproteobacteria bacterium]|nr:cytochrome c oxidase accessory protein CcoG [Alphaproteobacteria bacterium]